MEVITIGRWRLRSYREQTLEAFAKIRTGSPEECGCEDCQNFIAVRHKAYPFAALAIFARLGIDPVKEAEIWHTHRDESGNHHYGGFFHFVGVIESGKDAKETVNGVGCFDLERSEGSFEFGFTSDAHLIPESFADKQLVQLEFQTLVPWVLNAKEPD
jgi:hypothetical protein